MKRRHLSLLDESNVMSPLPEALSADVETILADQTSLVGADAARSAALAVCAWTRVPNSFVSHGCGCFVVGVDLRKGGALSVIH